MEKIYELTEFKLDDGGIVLIETQKSDVGKCDELVSAGKQIKKAGQTFNNAIGTIKEIANTAISSIKQTPSLPSELTLEFGLKLSAETTAIVAGATAEGNVKVTFKWVNLRDNPER